MLKEINVNGTAYPIGGDIADGQWVNKLVTVFNTTPFSSTGIKTYSVSNYLPDNEHVYEIMVTCYATSGSTSGDSCNWWVGIDDNNSFNQVMGYCQTRTASSVSSGNSGILPMKQENGVLTFKVNVTDVGGGTSNNGMYLAGYRRLRDVEANEYTLTINPTPADATVTFDKGTVVGNTCTVTEGTTVTYTVSKSGYATISASVIMNENKTVNVTLQQGIQMYGYTYTSGGNTAYGYMMGGISTSYYFRYCGTSSTGLYEIQEITGTLGASGSKVKAGGTTGTYTRTITINGIRLYCYGYSILGNTYEHGVLENSVVGNKCVGLYFVIPTSANSSQVNWSGIIYNRNSTLDYVFTGE